MVKTIKEIRDEDNRIEAGVYLEKDGTYTFLTYSKSGNCKKLTTAMGKAGLSA